MEDAVFKSLSKEQLFEGFSLCRSNATGHFDCAKIMFDKGIYGIANSHLILGAEEGIKATLLISHYFNVNPGIESITPYFKRHDVKHEKGKEMNEVSKVFIPVLNAIKAIIQKDSHSLFTNVFRLIQPNEPQKWWDSANKQKNEGFYVNYSNGKWQAPQNISKEDYLESKRAVQDIIDILEFTRSLKVDDYKLIPNVG